MANFNFGIDCESEEIAGKLASYIEGIDIYQQDNDLQDERVMLVSKQGLLDSLKSFAKENSTVLEVEVWPEGMDLGDAEDSDDVETHTLEP